MINTNTSNYDNESRFQHESKLDSVTSDNQDKNFSFQNEIRTLMYGFGDSESPDHETVELLESYVIEYVQNVSIQAFRKSKRRGFSEIKLKDLLQVIKNDKKKYYRVPPLLSFYETLKKTKKIENNISKKGYKKHIKELAKENN